MKPRIVLAAFSAMLLVSLSSAQAKGGFVGGIAVSRGSPPIPYPVQPYSADVVSITDRMLVDGNRIHQETHSKTMRDSQGRTRDELASPFGSDQGVYYVVITDPVQQEIITLDTHSKTAEVRHLQPPTGVGGAIGSASEGAPPVVPTVHPSNIAEPQNSPEQLGTREIEGFTTTGVRFTFTVPAGAIGNERPLVSTNESWNSVELGTALLTIYEDSQSGKTVRRLENIQRGEPDITLFEVPPDYTVKETQ